MSFADFFARHRETLDGAVEATRTRGYFSAYPESPSPRVYGETAAADGQAAFEALLGKASSRSRRRAPTGSVATEKSPYGLAARRLATRGSTPDGVDDLLAAAPAGLADWRDAGIEARVGVGLEILARLHARVFELANAVMHTSGQAFVMAFQAGGAHALDRALESIAYAYAEMTRVPATAIWEKPGRDAPDPDGEDVHRRPARPRAGRRAATRSRPGTPGPGLFASLVTGNPVDREAAPAAPCCRSRSPSRSCQEVLAEAGLRPEPGHARRRGPGRRARRDARRPPGGPAGRLHRRQRVRRAGSRTTPARRSCSPRRPASTRS